MEQYILKSAVVSEIEKLKGKINDVSSFSNGWQQALHLTEISINTLEVKEVKNIWHIVSETDLPKVGEHICCIKNGNILSGEYRANKFYGKVCDGYDNPIEKGDKWCRLYDLLDSLEVKEIGVDLDRDIRTYLTNHFNIYEDSVLQSKKSGLPLSTYDIIKVAKHFFELGLSVSNSTKVAIPDIDDVLKENGVNPYSKEAKIIKESYFMAIEKLAQKGEEV